MSASPAMRVIELALFTGSLLIAGLVVLALLWSGEGPYRDLARANGVSGVVFLSHGPGGDVPASQDLDALSAMHREWSSYVTGSRSDPPERSFGRSMWTEDEYAHMADVRRVFSGAKLFVPVALIVIAIRLQRARVRGARDMWQLVRDGALIAAGLVALIGVVAAVAFEPLFLAFHYIFFPQGNFLFDPATSNIVRLYPDWYWEGITLRVGLSFIAFALALAAMSALRLARAK